MPSIPPIHGPHTTALLPKSHANTPSGRRSPNSTRYMMLSLSRGASSPRVCQNAAPARAATSASPLASTTTRAVSARLPDLFSTITPRTTSPSMMQSQK